MKWIRVVAAAAGVLVALGAGTARATTIDWGAHDPVELGSGLFTTPGAIDDRFDFSLGSGGLDHVGIVVDDKEAVRRVALEAGLAVAPSGGLRIRDPWGNVLEIVDYRDVQFSKAPEVLRGMGLDGLEKSEQAIAELREKGLAG